MVTTLTEEQRELVIRAARNQGGAQAVLQLLREAEFDAEETIVVLITAMTAMMEITYPPQRRVIELNGMLAATMRSWSGGLVAEMIQ